MPAVGATTNASSGSLAQKSGPRTSGTTPEAPFVSRWFSALAVRQALARMQVLGGAMTEADAGRALADEQAEYAITIVGPDMTPFLKGEEKDLAAKAYLQPKSGERTAAPPVSITRVAG